MRVLAYCDERYLLATRAVVDRGAKTLMLITSPPTYAREFDPGWLAEWDVIYLDLHGQPDSVYLYSGAHQETAALKVDTVRQAQLGGAVVIATTCYLPETPFIAAFLAAGASAVIGGEGTNFGGRTRLAGAQVLARLVLKRLEQGDPAEKALGYAQKVMARNLRLRFLEREATEDALAFKLFKRKESVA